MFMDLHVMHINSFSLGVYFKQIVTMHISGSHISLQSLRPAKL